MMKKFFLIYPVLLGLFACNQPSESTAYIYKTIKPEFIPFADWKKDKEEAIKVAKIEMERSLKNVCRKTGQGWTLKEVKTEGEMECEESDKGHRCRKKNYELECRQVDMR